jgi:hypothetical protein
MGHVARMMEKRNAYRSLAGKSEGKRLLGRPRHRWVDNNSAGSSSCRVGWYVLNCECGKEPSGSIKCRAGKFSSDCTAGGVPSSGEQRS